MSEHNEIEKDDRFAVIVLLVLSIVGIPLGFVWAYAQFIGG